MNRRVVLIVGPPGAGKSTLAQQLAADEGLTVLEAETFPNGGFPAAARRLGTNPNARAAVVRCCATHDEQFRWQTVTRATETIVLDVAPDICARRIADRRRPNWRGELLAAKRWHQRRVSTPPATRREW